MAVKRCRICAEEITEKSMGIPFCENCIAYLGVRDFCNKTGIASRSSNIIRNDGEIFKNITELVNIGAFKSIDNYKRASAKGNGTAKGLDEFYYKSCRQIYFSRMGVTKEDIHNVLKRYRDENNGK